MGEVGKMITKHALSCRFELAAVIFNFVFLLTLQQSYLSAFQPKALDNVEVEQAAVEGQPLSANIKRLIQALDYLGSPLSHDLVEQLQQAASLRQADRMQSLLDSRVLCVVSINPELRVKVKRGPATAAIQQAGYTPVIIKVLNAGTVANRLRMTSPQSGPVYAGAALAILQRQAQTELIDQQDVQAADQRFLELDIFRDSPMTATLSGLEVEYVIGLINSSEAGKREATLVFDVGQGTQDIGFRAEVPILFNVKPALPVRMIITDADGSPTTARLTIRDRLGHVYPPQAKRVAPDFFFQPQIYRTDGDIVALPPGQFTLHFQRGPEYRELTREFTVDANDPQLPPNSPIQLQLERWVDPAKYGYYVGDHHIHGAGCSHYEHPTQGVTPEDMFRQIKGEGLNVGCVLTWGPCFDFQRQFFSPAAANISEPQTVMKYDLEISGFGSQAMGHVCLLNLTDQTYPGSDGSSRKGWPTWTVPVLRWAKAQGGYTGFPHSAFHVEPADAAAHLIKTFDSDGDGQLSEIESRFELLPEPRDKIDIDQDKYISKQELTQSVDRIVDQLPNLALPDMNGRGALEICVSTAEGVCDFVSAMDTARIPEWNTWYHLLNCGFPLKVSGETDFPCMSSRRVGQGRVYVNLGQVDRIDFSNWCRGLAEGRSYVSDGFAHAFHFKVNGIEPGTTEVELPSPGRVTASAQVVFASSVPEGVAYGNQMPASGRRTVGDTVNLHAPRSERAIVGGHRLVELIVNGQVVAKREVPADDQVHELEFELPIERSSWVALRFFPQLHTNPVDVIIDGKPIRASRKSALWCAETVKLLWQKRRHLISEKERHEAEEAYRRSIHKFETIAMESER